MGDGECQGFHCELRKSRARVRLPQGKIARIHFRRILQRGQGCITISHCLGGAGEVQLQGAVVGVERSGAPKRREIRGDIGPIKMKQVDGTPEEQRDGRRDAQAAGHRASTRQPVKCAGDGTLRTVRNFFAQIAFIQKKRSDARIVELPDGAAPSRMK